MPEARCFKCGSALLATKFVWVGGVDDCPNPFCMVSAYNGVVYYGNKRVFNKRGLNGN